MIRKRLCLLLVVVGLGLPSWGATPVWITPDVPTTEGLNGTTLLPWAIYRYDGAAYSVVLTVPGDPGIDAIHKLDLPGDWLFSVDAPTNLGGALAPPGTIAEPRDVIRYDALAGAFMICMSGAASGIPPGSDVDSIRMDGGDTGRLIVGFDVPTDVPPFVGASAFEPGDLVRLAPTGPGLCPGWTVVAANPAFDGSAVAPPVPLSTNADGAEGLGPRTILAFDVPTDLPPFAGAAAFVPGRLAEWDFGSLTWSLFETLAGWPPGSLVDGISCGGGSAGRVHPTMTMTRAAGDVVLSWTGSCASGAQDYGIYEGTIGSWYSHSLKFCTDTPPLLTEQFTPGVGSHYYLVVPINDCNGSEGSYGRCSTGACLAADERPAAAGACSASQLLPGGPACP